MKRILLSIVLIIAMLICTASCNKSNSTSPIPETSENVWETLQKLSQKQYDEVKLDIQTVTDDIVLNASYILANSHVTYSIEQLNLLPSNGDLTNALPEYKTTFSGLAIIKDGKVDKIDGDVVDIPSYDELVGNFNFQESNFKNIEIEEGKLTAEVASVFGFIGTHKNVSNMKIVITYSDIALQKMEITYNTINSMVTTVYEFVE